MVLDDAHVLTDPQALALLDGIVDALDPGNRVVVASRTVPDLSLPLRRARGQVADLGFDDLRLDEDTVGRLLTLEGLPASHRAAAELVASTGGWAAAVRLLAPHPGAASGIVAPSAGDAEAEQYLRAFLTAEVLDRLPADLRSFVLDTAVLDELTPAACAAVSGRPDAPLLLEQLPDQTRLASRTSAPGGEVALRYHELFASFLRQRLLMERTSDEVRQLHRRAAEVTPPAEAVEHLLAAVDLDRAARQVTAIGQAQLRSGDLHLPAGWLDRFPEPVREAHPWLDLLDGRVHITQGRMAPARALLQRALAGLRARNDEEGAEGATRAALALSEAAVGVGDLAGAAKALEELDPADLPVALHANVLVSRLWLAFFTLDWPAISASLEAVCDLVLPAGDAGADPVLAFGLGSHLLFADPGPGWLEQRARTLLTRLPPDRPAAASVQATLAAAALLRGDVDDARGWLGRAEAVSADYGSLGWTDTDLHRARLGIALAQGDHRGVEDLVEGAVQRMAGEFHLRQQWALYAYARARSLALRGRGAEIRDACAPLPAMATDHDRADQIATRAVILALAARAEGDVQAAEALLRDTIPVQRAARVCLVAGDAEVELASLLLADARPADALDAARSALDRLAALGAIGTLLTDGPAHVALLERYVADGVSPRLAGRLLDAAGAAQSPPPAAVPSTGEVLTSREVEVLRLVSTGASNRDIAEALFISERTVKSHMTAVLRKLGAMSRTQAVAHARRQHLL